MWKMKCSTYETVAGCPLKSPPFDCIRKNRNTRRSYYEEDFY